MKLRALPALAGAALLALGLEQLRADGRKVVLTTGFSPVDAGRGRPHPDLVLTALLRSGTSSTQAVAVAGDTTSDVQSGVRAGAGFVAGVLSGAHDEAALLGAGAHAALPSVVDLRSALAARDLVPVPVG